MLSPRLASMLALLAFSTAASAAVDLTTIQRKIIKEPAYQSRPKYCLLVFGPEARTRIWLVQDGATLYVDRNGNGNLTEPDEKVAAEKNGADAGEGTYTFRVGEVRDGERVHKDLTLGILKVDAFAERTEAVKELLKRNPKAHGYCLTLEVDMPGHKGTGVGGRVKQLAVIGDATGALQLADRPQDAPILHFGGPLRVTLDAKQQLMIDRETDVVLGVGCQGLGSGTFTWIEYQNVIPADKYPTLDVVYPPKRPGDAPPHEHYELKQRC